MEKLSVVYRYQDALYERLSDKRALSGLTILPTVLLFGFVSVLPIIWAIYASTFDIPVLSPDWTFTGIGNYITVLASSGLWDSLGKSLVFSAGSTGIMVIVGTGLALLVNRATKFSSFTRTIFIMPFLIPTAVLGFIALWMTNQTGGIVNVALLGANLVDSPVLFYQGELAMISVILTNSWKYTAFTVLLVLARLQSIPEELYEAARVSGANRLQVFRDVTFPHIKSVLLIVILLRGVWVFNQFDIIYIMTGGGPAELTKTLPIFAYELGFIIGNLGEAAALSVMIFLMLAAAGVVYFYKFNPEEEVRVE